MKILVLCLLVMFSFTIIEAQTTFLGSLKSDQLLLNRVENGVTNSTGQLSHDNLLFREISGIFTINRMTLNREGLSMVNGGGFTSARLSNGSGSSGTLELFAGGGTGTNIFAGPDTDATQGRLFINDGGVTKIDLRMISGAGIISTQGSDNSDNTTLTWPSQRPDVGYIVCEDSFGQIQAGLIVNEDGTGSVFGDTKNFRMDHPEQPGKEIWYASLEGPEAAAYERGTAKLQYGETFIPFSDHFQLVVNPETMTVILTPHSADTYGLAVVEKTAKGFRVKEFKGGKGNFSFDWEVKGVRKGYEDYRVIRDAREMIPGHWSPSRAAQAMAANHSESIRSEKEEATTEVIEKVRLQQNRPNPSNGQTVIEYSVPSGSRSVELQLFDAAGKLVKQYQLTPDLNGQLEIAGRTLAPGSYSYSLLIDGELQASRQMIIAR